MSRFIKLIEHGGMFVIINVDEITAINGAEMLNEDGSISKGFGRVTLASRDRFIVREDPAAILALINSEDVPSGPVDQEELKQSLESERKTVRTERIAKMCKKIACAMDHPELHHSILYHLQDAHKIAFELWNEAMAARAEAKS